MSVGIHLIAAICALAIGGWQLSTPKGTLNHRSLGKIWILSMAVAAISSFWIPSAFALWGIFGPIHLLSVWVLICLIIVWISAHQRNIRRHQRFALGAYLGLVGAGLATLLPGRMVSSWIFGV